jgi:hypothetical protein
VILLGAVIAGFVAGYVRAHSRGRAYVLPHLHQIGLAYIGFLPQFLAFFFPPARRWFSQDLAALALVGSLLLLVVFAWCNRERVAFYWMGIGLLLNLAVIVLNGGLMPISPRTIEQVYPHAEADSWQVGNQLYGSKNVVLEPAETRLELLADRFVLPGDFRYRVAFSLGDVLIAIGVFWLLWEGGQAPELVGQSPY